MIVRLLPSPVRFLQAVTLSGACVFAVSFGQGCSGSDVEILGAGGRPATGVDEPSPSGGSTSEPMPPQDMQPQEKPDPPPTSGNEGTGGVPPLDPPDDVSPGDGGNGAGGSTAAGGNAAGGNAAGGNAAGGAPTTPPDGTAGATGTAGASTNPPPDDPPPDDPPPGEPKRINCDPPQGAFPDLKLTPIVAGLAEPTFVTAAPGDDTRLYVLEKSGAIRIVRNGQLLAEPFLNLSAFVDTFNEQGLVGLAFHPKYAENGRFFVQYAFLDPAREANDPHEIVLSEFARSAESPDRAVLESEQVLMVVGQPSDIHLAGMLAFGPLDGMLYISRGDGGTSESQDPSSQHGKILRIDVNDQSAGLPYAIPDGNLQDEVWSLGLRNPWRFSFDACIGDIYIGDVGESSFEEINFEPAGVFGLNYGWKTVEGPRCFGEEPVPACDPTGFTPAVLVYERDFGCAVTGGYVYHGTRIPSLRGTYLYADYCFGNFGSFRIEGGQAVDVRDITDNINPPTKLQLITSFGVDNGGEMYVLTQDPGALYRIDPE
jgi:glucose/arabinose dehydrogenase